MSNAEYEALKGHVTENLKSTNALLALICVEIRDFRKELFSRGLTLGLQDRNDNLSPAPAVPDCPPVPRNVERNVDNRRRHRGK